MATPQYAHALIKKVGANAKPFRVYCSDAAGSITWPDGGSNISFPFDVYLIDLTFAATLATTPTLTVWVGSQQYTILNTATLTAATQNRILRDAPIFVPRGAKLNIVQS